MLWLSRAAAAGVAKAQNHYGRMLQEGRGVAADPRLAAEFFEKAATQGDTDGMVNLGAACLVGRGVPQDEARSANESPAQTPIFSPASTFVRTLGGRDDDSAHSGGQRPPAC